MKEIIWLWRRQFSANDPLLIVSWEKLVDGLADNNIAELQIKT